MKSESFPDLAIKIENVSKIYNKGKPDENLALNDVSLSVPRGIILGLLGPNGAGKSTLINIMAGLVMKTAGNVNIWGIDIDKDARNARAAMGIVPQEINLDPFFTPRQALEIQAGLYGISKKYRQTDKILRQTNLLDKSDSHSRTLSGGMRRRLMLAKALVHTPPILVLDEPTAGVDIELRKQLWDYVMSLRESGITVLLTTHYLEEADKLCDRVAIIDNGRLIVENDTKSLKKVLDTKALILTLATDISESAEGISKIKSQILAEFEPDISKYIKISVSSPKSLELNYRTSKVSTGKLLSKIGKCGIEIEELSTKEADLEDVFLKLTESKS